MVHVDMSSKIHRWNPSEFLDVKNVCSAYALLILNRPISINRDYLLSLWDRAAVHVTVDGGTNRWYEFTEKGTCEKCVLPDLITGDMDSVTSEVLGYYKAKDVEVIQTPDQNETDFTKALHQTALYVKRKEIKIDAVIAVVETSGRLDQIIGNINSLYKAESILGDVPVFLHGRNSLTWRLGEGFHEISIPLPVISSNKWCSLVPFGSPARVTTTGLKWNLDDRILEFGKLVSTSNTFSGSTLVTVHTNSNVVWSMALNNTDRDDDED
ncbi:CLUMA_CG005329, isoform A [Gryllus bimaculatus]|nr:CLUMA_CG005329, isoform A [Gryllus bimaculatus]